MKAFADFLIMFQAGEPALFRCPENPWKLHSEKLFFSKSDELLGLIHEHSNELWDIHLLGEVFNYRDKFENDAAAILDSFLRDLTDGREAPGKLNGHFILLGKNRPSGEWHVWTNRMGTMHAYYADNGKQAAIGTFFPAVAQAASAKRLDWTGLSGFFGFGFFPEDRTYYQDVRILRPATHFIFDKDGHLKHSVRYWNWWHEPDYKRSYEDTVDQFGQILKIILSEQGSGRMAIPISGGLDSRTAAAVLTEKSWGENGNKLCAYSYGYTDYSSEISIARKIAAVRNLPFEAFVIPNYLFDRIPLILNSVEGFQGIASTRQAAIVEKIAGDADYLMAAHWGDVWMDDMGFLNEKSPTEENISGHAFHKVEKRGAEWLLKNLCAPRLKNRSSEELLQGIVKSELERVRQIEDPDFRIKAFKTEQWSFRWTLASLRMFQPAAFPRLPFYDNRMVDFCCSIPSEFVAGRKLQIDYLKKFHPDLARITWDVTDSSLFHYQYYNSWLLPKRAWKKMARIFKHEPHVGRNWEIQFLNEKGKAGLERHLLKKGLKLHEFVSPEAVANLLQELFSRPGPENGYSVSSLLTFSTWLEHFG